MKNLLLVISLTLCALTFAQDVKTDTQAEINHYTQMIKEHPDSGFLYLMRASLYQEILEYDNSKNDAQKGIKYADFNPWGYLFLARANYYGEKDLKSAIKNMGQAIDLIKLGGWKSPDPMYLYIEKSTWYYESNEKSKALAELLKAQAINKNHYRINYELAEHYFYHEENYDRALHFVNFAIEKNPNEVNSEEAFYVVDLKVRILNKMRRFDQAQSLLKPYYKNTKVQSVAYVAQSTIYQAQGKFDQARECVDLAEKANPSVDRNYERANIERGQLNFKGYLEYIYKYLNGKELNAFYYGSLATAYSETGEIDEAVKYYELTLENGGNTSHYYNSYAYFLARNEIDLKLADSLIDKAVELEPGNIFYEDTYCFIKSMKGDVDEALDYYEKNLKLKRVHFEIVDHLYFKGYKAMQYLNQDLVADSNYYDGWVQVSLLGDTMSTFYLLNPSNEDLHATSFHNFEYTFEQLEIEGNDWVSYEELPYKKEDLDQRAAFIGGDEALDEYLYSKNLNPDQSNLSKDKLNVVYVRFVVTKEGEINKVSVVRGVDYSVDKKVIETIEKMPKWIPAMKDGKSVSSLVTIPVFVKSR